MAAPYLLEIRTGGAVKSELREIIYDVADRFGVQGAAKPRAVPHVTLFGPYNTDHGHEVRRATQSVLAEYDVVPYRISGFGRFPENSVIYADVHPSPELRSLRRDLVDELKPLTYNYRDYDLDHFYDYHVTIAFKDVGRKFDGIWEYVTDEYSPDIETYATRITSLRRRYMMWEWDVPRGRELGPDKATTAESWRATEKALAEHTDGDFSEYEHDEPSGILATLRSYCPL